MRTDIQALVDYDQHYLDLEVATDHPALHSLKKILIWKWHLVQNQQRLREIFKEPPLMSHRKGKSLKDLLVRTRLLKAI